MIVPAAYIGIVVLWLLHPPDAKPEVLSVLNTMIGILGAAMGVVISFFFGSNSGSKAKDDTISTMAVNAASSAPLQTLTTPLPTTTGAPVTEVSGTTAPATPLKPPVVGAKP